MIAALLLRFADRFVVRLKGAPERFANRFPSQRAADRLFRALAAPEKLCFNSFVAGANHRSCIRMLKKSPWR